MVKDRYAFLKTTEHDGHPVALIADEERLGADGVKSLRMAFAAHAAPRIREGVIALTVEQLRERLPELERDGMPNSVEAYKRAIHVIEAKTGGRAPDTPPPGPGKDTPPRVDGPRRATPGQDAPRQGRDKPPSMSR